MENNASILEADISLIPSILKFFVMFQMCLFHDKDNEEDNFVEAVAIKCSNFRRNADLYLKYKTVQEIITQFLLDTVFNHVSFFE